MQQNQIIKLVLQANYFEPKNFLWRFDSILTLKNDLSRVDFGNFCGVLHNIGCFDKGGYSTGIAHWYPIILDCRVPKATKISKRHLIFTWSHTNIKPFKLSSFWSDSEMHPPNYIEINSYDFSWYIIKLFWQNKYTERKREDSLFLFHKIEEKEGKKEW